jgi:hypothetical protein
MDGGYTRGSLNERDYGIFESLGTVCVRPCYLKRKASTFGDTMPQVNIQQNLHTKRTATML